MHLTLGPRSFVCLILFDFWVVFFVCFLFCFLLFLADPPYFCFIDGISYSFPRLLLIWSLKQYSFTYGGKRGSKGKSQKLKQCAVLI